MSMHMMIYYIKFVKKLYNTIVVVGWFENMPWYLGKMQQCLWEAAKK